MVQVFLEWQQRSVLITEQAGRNNIATDCSNFGMRAIGNK